MDAQGAAYVTGYTFSTDFPTTIGGLETTANGDSDVFVTKFNADGSALIYSTYLGGSGAEEGRKIAVDLWGNAYVTGSTFSTNFPTTTGALDTTANGDADAFITKLNTGGSALVYSTYLGGVGYDRGAGIAVDLGGAAVVTGFTLSADFPTTLQAFDTSYNGGTDAFVRKINASGSALVYSSYFGGAADDFGLDVAVDLQGAAYVTGSTQSPNFPTSSGFSTALNGPSDLFVTKLNSRGSALVYSTYLGGSDSEEALGHGIALDGTGAAYVTGSTYSTNFPVTSRAFHTSSSGFWEAVVVKITDLTVPSAAPQPVTAPPPVSLPVPVPGPLPVPLPGPLPVPLP